MKEQDKFFNRELSWLEFNQRVLDQALDTSLPLLERLKFISIVTSNLDEFFRVRVGGLMMLQARGSTYKDPAGMTPAQQLEAISRRVHQMYDSQSDCFTRDIESAMDRAGIKRITPEELNSTQRRHSEFVFENEIFPVLSPIAIDLEGDNALVFQDSIHILVKVGTSKEEEGLKYALIPVSGTLNRFVSLPSQNGDYEYILIEDIIQMMAGRFFPGIKILEAVPFRINRNADLEVQDDLVSDLLSEMEDMVDARERSTCVQLEISDHVTSTTLDVLTGLLRVDKGFIFTFSAPLRLSDYMTLANISGYEEVKVEPWPPRGHPDIDESASMFDNIDEQEFLVYHPYQSFEPVVRFIQDAAGDPHVAAIKQTLYRTSGDSPIITALKKAASNGKYVTALVELKARFDESRNIEWARELENSGIQVLYGVKGLKTHSKVCMIIRRTRNGVKRYIHFGTGNYNDRTAKLYCDVGFFTCDEELGNDTTAFFNAITGYSELRDFNKLAVSPFSIRKKLIALIHGEIERKEQGLRAHIRAKFNSLSDPCIIQELYNASCAGVRIELNIRGICCLRPGVQGLSENITVTSIIDRYLEHARIFYFYHGGEEQVFISSADWMQRNFDKRVELMVPVEDPGLREQLADILDICLADNVNGKILEPDGTYRVPDQKPGPVRSQEEFYRRACKAARENSQKNKRTVLEPHKNS